MRADDWIPIDKAPARVQRGKSTVYRWIQQGKIRTLLLHRKTFVNVADLLDAETTRPGRPPTEM